jgi:hypothetical protein
MLLVYKKLHVRVSKFCKVILPKTKGEETNFESISTNIIADHIVYQLHGTIEMITFYKKANLNAYKRIQNTKDYTLQERLKVNIIPKHVVYAYKGHDFNIYFADEFIFIVYSTNCKKSRDAWTWHVVIYDTKRNILTKYYNKYYKSYGGIYGFYYLRNCKKVILPVGNPIFSGEVFHKSHDTRRGFNLGHFYVIYLNKPTDNGYSHKNEYIGSHIEKYIEDKYSHKCKRIMRIFTDYNIDTNKGVIYTVCKIICSINVEYKAYVLVLEYDLCNESHIKSFEIEVPTRIIEVPTSVSEDPVSSDNILLYLSNKQLRNKGMPKYLPMHISSEFYDFMSNKLFHADMIFSSHSRLLVKDKYFNRVDGALYKIESLKVAAHMPLQEDIITMRSGRNNKVLAVLLICDLCVGGLLNLKG